MCDIEEVNIEASGTFKYILIKLTWSVDGESNSKIIVRGFNWAEYHADILDEVSPKFDELGLEYECIGGGRIKHDSEAKTIKVYGYSMGFGQANHKVTCDLLARKYNYSEGFMCDEEIRVNKTYFQKESGLYDSLPDQPIQLVRPDPLEHRKLEIIHSNVKYLHHVNYTVAVIAVVGKFHSGKSFLLNQLMGKQEGFGIGPSVKPQTMGIWMWGKPMTVHSPSGEPLAVIFLDTEGFAANNISESYDAKIFSVATLLSSYLIYNSVKIIDQGDIDYLELLSRRTQLFALRSQITRSQWFEQFNHDLLKFPPLVWVVQDFVQSTENGESSRQWLHRIMESNSRESVDYDINLLGIFDSVDCHTLFLPATKRTLLQDLSKASEDDLTPEYKEERDELLNVLMRNLVPKEKNGRPISGPELAMLLEILVTAANEGSLAEIPGRWEVFISELRVGALEDCVTFYDSDMKLLDQLHDNGAINETELELWHSSAIQKAEHLLQQLLFGLEAALLESAEEFRKIVMEKYEMIVNLNDKKIQLKCSEVQRKIEIKTEESLQSLVFPIGNVELLEIQTNVTRKWLQEYSSMVFHLSDNEAYHRHYEQLKIGIQHIFDAIKLKNNAAFEKLLNEAITLALEKFRTSCANYNQIPRTSEKLEGIINSAVSDARKVFELSSQPSHDESIFEAYTGLMEVRLHDEIAECRNENSKLVKDACETQANELINRFRHNTGASKISLPMKDENLDTKLELEKKSVFQDYHHLMGNFDDTTVFREISVYLEKELHKVCAQRKDENYQAYIKEVQVPLNTAKKVIVLAADLYDTEFSIQQYMMEVCLLNLDEGKAKNWDESLKIKIAQKYIQDSSALQNIIISKRGLWSSLKGFFQWIISHITSLLQ